MAATATVNSYIDRGETGFANLTLPSGERVLISVTRSGLRVHRLWLWGRLPGRSLHVSDAAGLAQIVRVLGRDPSALPELPDKAAMDAFLVVAAKSLGDPSAFRGQPSDEDEFPMTNLTVVTRAALAEPDAEALVRRYSRAAATP